MASVQVIPAFQPFEDRRLGLCMGFESTTAEQFPPQCGEEALGHGVVVGITQKTYSPYPSSISTPPPNGTPRLLGSRK